MARKSKQARDAYYVQYVTDCVKQAEDAEDHLRKEWAELWQVYQSRQDNSRKADWQSKTFAPKIFMQIEKSAGEIKRAVLQTTRLFKFELDDFEDMLAIEEMQQQAVELPPEQAEQLGAFQKKISDAKRRLLTKQVNLGLIEKRFKRDIKQTNMRNVYPLMIKAAFLLGIGVPKVLWDSKKKKVKYEHVDRMNFYISPEYQPFQHDRPPYVVEYKRMPLARLKKLAREAKAANAEGWNFKAIKDLEEDIGAMDEKAKERQRRGLSDAKKIKKEVEIWEFWGDVINEDDTDIEENLLLVVANKQHMIRRHENPFQHKKPPYPLAIPLPYPHRGSSGTSLAAPLIKPQYTYNNILNMWVDNLNFSINKMFQYNPNSLVDPKSLTSVYPGKKIQVNSDAPAVTEIPISPVGKEPLQALEAVDRVMQEGSNVTEFVAGYPGSKSKTLGEVELKTAQSRGLFDVIARDIEENSLKELLEMSYDLYAQFGGYPAREGLFTISVGGVSLQLMRRELIEQLREVLIMALQSPVLNKITEVEDLWRKFLGLYNMDEAYIEQDTMAQQLRPEQMQGVQGKAEADAKRLVAGMSEEQIMNEEIPAGAGA